MIYIAYFKTLAWALGSDKSEKIHGDSFDDATKYATTIAKRKGWKLVSVEKVENNESSFQNKSR